jgi:hypothetical protein
MHFYGIANAPNNTGCFSFLVWTESECRAVQKWIFVWLQSNIEYNFVTFSYLKLFRICVKMNASDFHNEIINK